MKITTETAIKDLFGTGWVARDRDIYNNINVHKYEPTRRIDDGFWHSDDFELVYKIPSELFPWLKWEDEPLNIEEFENTSKESSKAIPEPTGERKVFHDLCLPLVDYLYEHGTPHSTIIITQANAEMVNGEIGVTFKLRD